MVRQSLRTAFAILLFAAVASAVKPVQIITKSLTAGQNGVAYSATLRAKFGTKPYTWSVGSGTLPTGLSLAGATGIISGTPTVNNTFNFVIHIVDSTGTPTTDDRSFSMTVTGSAPVTAVSITTTSLPAGTNGVAYTATLQAANGVPPYTWSTPVGTLPPGVTLAVGTGVLSGTPTASGTYSFTARVTDSIAGTHDRAFAIAIAQGAATYLFQDDFESGNFSAWTQIWDATHLTIGTDIFHAGSKSAKYRFTKCGDSTDPACGSAHADVDYMLYKYFSSGLSEFYLRGYFYIKTPEAGAVAYHNRKLFYIFRNTPGSSDPSPWSVILAVGDPQTVQSHWLGTGPMYMTWGVQSGQIGGTSFQIDCGNGILVGGCSITYDAWHWVEVHVKDSTVLAAPFDGVTQIWLDGTLVYDVSTASLNRGLDLPLRWFLIGQQVDRFNYNPVDEYRYWDDIVFNATGPIGP